MVGKIPLSTVATFSKVLCVNYHRFPSQSHWGVIIIPLRFSYALWRSQFTLLFGKVRKSEMRGSPQEISLVLYLHFNHKTDLTFLIKTFTIKVRSLCVVLMISPLVVRRTFYLIVNDRDLALKIRLLFSIAIQLSVVSYIIQPVVVNVNDFLQNFKIIF